MAELSIRIKIGEREYPMRVEPGDEERLRQAGKALNERIKAYRDQFGVDDKQDLLAMVAFDCYIEKLQLEEENSSVNDNMINRVQNLNELISKVL